MATRTKFVLIAILCLVSLPLFGQSTYTDNFAGSGALSGNWTQTSASGYGTCTRVSGTIQPSSTTVCAAVYTGGTFLAQSYMQAVVSGALNGSNSSGICWMTVAGNGYCYLASVGRLYLLTAGAGVSDLGTCPVPSNGDTIKLIDNSNTLTCIDVTTSSSATYFDGTYTSGLLPTMYVDHRAATTDSFTNFQAGPFTALTCTPSFMITSSTANSIVCTGTNTTWTAGTPGSPTFSVSGVSASITAQVVNSSTQVTLTMNAGATQGTATITDPSTSNTAAITVHTPNPWYIRTDGGTAAQCDGHHNLPLSSSPTCGLIHPMYLTNAFGGSPTWRSDYFGADGVYFEDVGPYYIGQQNGGLGTNWAALGFPCSTGTSCLPNQPSGGGPALLAGWYGYCYTHGGCHTSITNSQGNPHIFNLVNPTQFLPVGAPFYMFSFINTNYTDFEGFDLSQPITCTRVQITPGNCASGTNFGYVGLMFQNNSTDNGPSNGIFKDINIHGLSNVGIQGYNYNNLGTNCGTQSANTCTTILDHIKLMGNGVANYNGDAYGGGCQGTANCRGQGTLVWNEFMSDFSGGVEVEPNGGYSATTGLANNGYNYFTDDLTNGGSQPPTAGYGDSLTIGSALAGFFTLSNSTSRYCTQDAFDFLHLADFGITYPISIYFNGNWGEGCEGNTFKMGGIGTPVQLYSNVAIPACYSIQQTTTFPWTLNPSGYGTNLGDVCRAQGTAWLIGLNDGFTTSAIHNSTFGYVDTVNGGVMYDVKPVTACTGSTCNFIFQDNITVGFVNPAGGGTDPKGLFLDGLGVNIFANAGSKISYNNWFNVLATSGFGVCPQQPTYETNSYCSSPLVNSQSNVYAINPTLTSSSAVRGLGVTAGPTLDFTGVTAFLSPPSIGGLEFNNIVLPPLNLSGKILFQGKTKLQ